MTTLIFVLFWVLLAAALVFIGLRVGRGKRTSGKVRSRHMPRSWTLGFVIATVVFGVLVPAAVVNAFLDRSSVRGDGVGELTSAEQHGRELFGQRCKNCHSLEAANASANVGPNLDQLRPPAGLVLNAIEEGRSRGNGQMPADLVEGEDAKAVAAFVAKATGASQ